MKRPALATLILALVWCLPGCLSDAQRAATIEDLKATRDLVTALLPPGERRDAILRDVAAAQTAEQLIQVRAAARAASTQPSR